MKKIPEDIRELEEKIARQREKENRLREPAGASEYAGAVGGSGRRRGRLRD